MHNDSFGKKFQGVYDLVIDSKVARCLYKYSDAPISASVSISSSDGNQSVATTVVTEKNGWFRMGAYGFHYSAPTIRVKLSQEAPAPAPTPTPTPTPTATPVVDPAPSAKPVVAKKVTVTCVKGKTVKKVTAVKPVCPAGFKKK